MRIDNELLCSAIVLQNATPGGTTIPKNCFQIEGVTDGAGHWTFTGTGEAAWDINMENLVLDITLGLGSAFTGGVTYGVSTVGANQFGVTIVRIDTGASIDIPFFLTVWRRKVVSWD